MLTRPARRADRRPGSVALEVLLVAPVVLTFLLGLVQLGQYLVAEEKLAEASAQAAMLHAQGASKQQVLDAVKAVLGDTWYQHATVRYNDCGTSSGSTPPAVQQGELVIFRIELPANVVSPNLIGFLGGSACSNLLVGQSAYVKQ